MKSPNSAYSLFSTISTHLIEGTYLIVIVSLSALERVIHIGDQDARKPVFELKNYLVRSSLRSFEQGTENSALSIKCVLSGEETYHVDGRKHQLHAGQFLLVNKGQQIHCAFQNPDLVHGFCIYLDEELLRRRISEIGHADHQLLDNPVRVDADIPWFRDLTYSIDGHRLGKFIWSAAQSLPDFQSGGTGAFFHDITEQLLNHQLDENQRVNHLPAAKKTTREEVHRRINRAVNYIHDNYTGELTIADLAEVACLSEFHFLRSFKQGVGETPHKYRNRLRLEKAGQLLKTQSGSVTEVAHQVGFQDTSSFGRLFKQHFQCTPKQYRS